jgi:class 3 adenylate cyclase/tetratricopeptide (TPR) repeat protein
MATCPSCGSESPDGFAFCPHCGAKLTSTPAEEQRKVCTILFCDLVGFTQRSEQLDPEDVRAFLLPYYELMTDEVTRHGGAIDKLYGDGAMTVFGVPTAHEDDPERAIRASLRVLKRLPSLGLDLEARIGINTGEVVVSIDDAARGDALTGDTVNTASRVQAAAPVGGVVVGELTYGATKHVFDYEVLAPVELKGKAEPVAIYQPVAPIATVAGEVPDTTPFVGRDAELRALIEGFERTRAGEPTVVTIVAEPGIGKSRLVREFGRYLDKLPDLVTWRQGRCLPYGDGVSFWALGEIVKTHAGILDTDDQPTLSAKLDAVLTEPGDETRTWVKDRLAPLVGLRSTSAAPRRGELFAAWRRFIAAIAADGPLVLVIEDLHWADEVLVAFLLDLRASLTGLPLLVLVTARPEVAERHPDWLDGSELRVGALDARSMRDLVAATLPDASDGFIETVCERAGGSPLYAEQLAAMRRTMPIGGGSVDDLPVPPTVQALLTARMDQLAPDLRSTLLDASVIGKTLWPGAVAVVGEIDASTAAGRLDQLVAREFVRREPASSIEDEHEYAFVHALVRDVAYGQLSRRPRFMKHRATADWITAKAGHPLGDLAEIVVAHLDQAKDAAEAAGLTDEIPALDSDLIDALTDASLNAEHTDVRTSAGFAERALTFVAEGDQRRPMILLQAGSLADEAGDFGRGRMLVQEAVPGLRELGAWDELGGALVNLAEETKRVEGRERGLEMLTAAEEEMSAHPGPGYARLLVERAFREWDRARLDEALVLLDRADALVEAAGLPPDSRSLSVRGQVEIEEGNVQHGAQLVRDAADRALARGDAGMAITILNDLGATTMWHGTYDEALMILDRVVTMARERGFGDLVGQSPRMRAMYHLGLWDAILSEAPALIESAMTHGDVWIAEGMRISLTRVLLDRGGAHLDLIDEAAFEPSSFMTQGDSVLWAVALDVQLVRDRVNVGPLRDRVDTGGEVIAQPVLVDALIRVGESDLAERVRRSSPDLGVLIDDIVDPWNEGLLAEASGDVERATSLLTRVLESARGRGSKPDHARLLLHLGRCRLAMGDRETARRNLKESRELWIAMEADARLEEVDAALADL